MTERIWMRSSSSRSDQKSKTCPERNRCIQNRKRAGILAIALAFVFSGAVVQAQQAKKVWRIGFLGSGSAAGYKSRVNAMREGLRDLGYVEGKNIVIEYRWAEEKYDRLPNLAAELVGLKVDLIITHGTPGSRAAKQATTTIPIVITAIGDAVEAGVVASLARPGGNITGSSFFLPELTAKRLELIKEAIPSVNRVAVLLNPDNRVNQPVLKEMQSTARALGLELQQAEVRSADDFAGAFSTMVKKKIGALAVPEDAMLNSQADRIADLSIKNRLPTIGSTLYVGTGLLIGYGQDVLHLWRRTGVFVDKILKGTTPADLPVEQPMKFELAINLKTAKRIGVTISPNVLVRADK
jgi:putative tryptophan/tyrosine transport system substrate-binding protein